MYSPPAWDIRVVPDTIHAELLIFFSSDTVTVRDKASHGKSSNIFFFYPTCDAIGEPKINDIGRYSKIKYVIAINLILEKNEKAPKIY